VTIVSHMKFCQPSFIFYIFK